MTRHLTIAVLLPLALVAAACSDGETVEADGGTTTTDRPPAAAEIEPPAATPTPTTTTVSPDDGAEGGDAAAFRSDFYSVDSRWLCRADLDDVCDEDYVTVIQADGSRTVEEFTPAEHPPADCFYAYPTVAFDESGNADIDDDDNSAEENVAANQIARFGEGSTLRSTARPHSARSQARNNPIAILPTTTSWNRSGTTWASGTRGAPSYSSGTPRVRASSVG